MLLFTAKFNLERASLANPSQGALWFWLLHPFLIADHFGKFKYVVFATYSDIMFIYVRSKNYICILICQNDLQFGTLGVVYSSTIPLDSSQDTTPSFLDESIYSIIKSLKGDEVMSRPCGDDGGGRFQLTPMQPNEI